MGFFCRCRNSATRRHRPSTVAWPSTTAWPSTPTATYPRCSGLHPCHADIQTTSVRAHAHKHMLVCDCARVQGCAHMHTWHRALEGSDGYSLATWDKALEGSGASLQPTDSLGVPTAQLDTDVATTAEASNAWLIGAAMAPSDCIPSNVLSNTAMVPSDRAMLNQLQDWANTLAPLARSSSASPASDHSPQRAHTRTDTRLRTYTSRRASTRAHAHVRPCKHARTHAHTQRGVVGRRRQRTACRAKMAR